MDSSIVYIKTARGTDEIASRSHGLASRARALLIMIDGRRSAATLLAQSAERVEAESHLASLLDGGFIEIVEQPAGAESAAASIPVAPAPVDLHTVKQYINQTLHNVMGPDADLFTVKVDAVNDAHALLALTEKLYQVIQGMGGKKKADDFKEKVSSLLA